MKIVVTGASGFIGAHIFEALRGLGDVVGTYFLSPAKAPMRRLDITDSESVNKIFDEERPDVVVHAAALTSTSECESKQREAVRINVEGATNVVQAAMESKSRPYVIFMSTDMVFDGKSAPYNEDSRPHSLSVYGATKFAAENRFPPDALILRLALCFGRSLNASRRTFFEDALSKIARGEDVIFFRDEWRTPVWVGDIMRLITLFLEARPQGILHVGGPERMTRAEMGVRACKALGIDSSKIKPILRKMGTPNMGVPIFPRPEDLSLDSTKLKTIFPDFKFTDFEEAIRRDFIF